MKIKSLCSSETRVKKVTTLTPYKPFALVVIGEEMEKELRKMKIGAFISWLKVEARGEYKNIKDSLSQFEDSDILSYADEVDEIDNKLKEYLKIWIKDSYKFPFKYDENTKFLSISNTTLLTKVFDIDFKNVQNFDADDIVEWLGDNSALYHVIVVGYSFSECKINGALEHINDKKCCIVRNWFVVNNNQEYGHKANDFISTHRIDARIQDWNRYVCSLPISIANRKRRIRYRDFQQFREVIEEKFNRLCLEDRRGSYYRDRCSFNVLNSNRNGHTEDTVAEVFWGNYPYDRNTESKSFYLRIASGCSLVFLRHDNGYVSIYLLPGKTENQEAVQTGYVLKKNIDPSILLNDIFIKELWDMFMAYTECTSLDGEPTWCQKTTYFRLWCFRRRLTNGGITSSRFLLFGSWIGKWVLTVGLSGLLLSVITYSASRCEDKKEDSKNVNVKGEVMVKIVSQDSIRNNREEDVEKTKKSKGNIMREHSDKEMKGLSKGTIQRMK